MAIPATSWLWGFTVDDALITARVAAHCAQGIGPRFNPNGPVTDAVTPLGYAQLLALFGQTEVLAVFALAKWCGCIAWLSSAGLLGWLIARSGTGSWRFSPLAIVAISAPLGAWAVSGMETGLVTLLATLGLLGGSPAALALGVAAAWRPELTPFAGFLVALRLRGAGWSRAVLPVSLLVLPVLVVALIRFHYFGRAVPLSFYAKPSDFGHGLRYALGAFAFTGFPCLLLASPRELGRLPRAAWPLFIALLGHAVSLVLCGGDWMALYRLVVPVLPCAALAAAYLADRARPSLAALRFILGGAGALLLLYGRGPAARKVGADRARLIAEARPLFAHDSHIASLDVGWVGAARDAADIIDLAGVTDPQVALFPGGHTSKNIPRAWLFAQQPTAVVLFLAPAQYQLPGEPPSYSRAVEAHVARLIDAEFRERAKLRLGTERYLVLEPIAR